MGKPAIGSGNDVVTSQQPCQAQQPFGNQFRVLNHVRTVADHTRNEFAPFRQLDVFPHPPLVGMPGIGHFDAIRAGVHSQYQVHDVADRDIADMGYVKAPPADVIAHLLDGYVSQGVVQRFDPQ